MKAIGLLAVLVLACSLFSPSSLAESRSGQNTSNVAIPDAASTTVPGAWVSSTIAISGAPAGAVVTGIDVTFRCAHPYSGDLVVDINADSTGALGNIHVWNREGGSADNPTRTVNGITTYNGLTVNRTWYLYARDYAPGDVGNIDEWSITVYYQAPPTPTITSVSPSQPVATGAAQPFTITGANFISTATVDLEDVTDGEQFYNRPVSSRVGTTGITINPNFGTEATTHTWRVRVNNGSVGSAWFSFTVTPLAAPQANGFDYPFGVPNGTPRCPGTAQCPNGWQNVQDFRVNDHLGEDWNFGYGGDDLGAPVYAAANGLVTYAQDNGIASWRGVVIILHSGSVLQVPGGSPVSQVKTMYAHLDTSRINDWIAAGSTVTRGQQIGVIGPTPSGSTGPHLHFEVRTNTSIGLGDGYGTDAVGWTDPSNFIDANRPSGTQVDSTLPMIAQFSVVSTRPLVLSYNVADAGGSGLNRVELWRANINGTPSDSSWTQRSLSNITGNGPVTGSFTDDPSTPGSYWYGIHVVDNAGNLVDERMAGLGPIHVLNTCPADFNQNGQQTIDDLFLYFNAYFMGSPSADFNGQGGVTIDDLFLFMNAWFVGC